MSNCTSCGAALADGAAFCAACGKSTSASAPTQTIRVAAPDPERVRQAAAQAQSAVMSLGAEKLTILVGGIVGAIAAEIRAEDVGARYGGDEFCIMFEGTPAAGAAMCLERIKARVENTPFFSKDGRRFATTLSFGVSDLADRSVPELIEAADRALYDAKSRGRSRIVVDAYAPPIRKHA